jgi:hypothetical protein
MQLFDRPPPEVIVVIFFRPFAALKPRVGAENHPSDQKHCHAGYEECEHNHVKKKIQGLGSTEREREPEPVPKIHDWGSAKHRDSRMDQRNSADPCDALGEHRILTQMKPHGTPPRAPVSKEERLGKTGYALWAANWAGWATRPPTAPRPLMQITIIACD